MPYVPYSKLLDAPAAKVWARVRAFDVFPQCIPGFIACELKEGARPDQVGAVRVITQTGGLVVEEVLLELSDHNCRVCFTMTKGDTSVLDTYSRVTVHEDAADGRAFVEWSMRFDAKGDRAAVAAWVRNDFLRPALDKLEQLVRADA